MSLMTQDPQSERELVERCRSGADPDHGAFRRLYERYAPEALRLLERLLGERQAAEDALQETFVRLHRGLGAVDLDRPLRPYVLRIARNAGIEALRRRERQKKLAGPLGDEELPAPDGGAAPAEAREAAALIEAALERLGPEHRAAVVLRYTHGLKLEEMGRALGCTERTARNRLRAAAVLLERELRRLGLGEGEVAS